MQYNTLAFKIQMLDMLSIIVSCHEFLIKVIKRTYVNQIHIWVRVKGGIFQRRHQSGPGEGVCVMMTLLFKSKYYIAKVMAKGNVLCEIGFVNSG